MNNKPDKHSAERALKAAGLSEIVGNPLQILREAIGKVPALKFAFGIVGIAAGVAAIISLFKLNYWIPIVGVVLMLIFMPVLAVFAKAASSQSKASAVIGQFFIWCSVLLTLTVAVLLVTSTFWNWPKSLRDVFWFGDRVTIKDPSRGPDKTGTNILSPPAKPNTSVKEVKSKQQPATTLGSEPRPNKTAFIDAVVVKVLDKDTHQPVRDANVKCETNEKPLITDSDGEFACNAPARKKTLWIEIDAHGYKSFHEKVNPDSKSPIELEKMPESK